MIHYNKKIQEIKSVYSRKVRILNRLIKAGTHQATSCGNTSQQPIALCVLENFVKSFITVTELCLATSHTKSDQTEFV